MRTQNQLYWQAHERLANIYKAFMEMVRENNITSGEIEKLIQKRPETYGHLESWIETLRQREEKTIKTHTNQNGIEYYSKETDDGLIYSFDIDFEDYWTADDEETNQ